jgi:hypothetical protein
MDKMNRALERAKMLVGMEVDEEAAVQESSSFIDDFNRQCTLSTTQVKFLLFLSFSLSRYEYKSKSATLQIVLAPELQI